MFCPNCGNEIPNDSKFCGSCGADISGVTSEPAAAESQAVSAEAIPPAASAGNAPAHEFVQFQKKPDKKKIVTIAAVAGAALVVVIALVGLISLFAGGSSDNSYVYLENGKYELLTDIKKDKHIEIASGKNDSVRNDLLCFDPDGKYIYYYTKYDSYEGTGSLCRAEYGKLKANSGKNDKYIEIIGTNVELGFEFMNDGSVLYKNGAGTLFRYKDGESVQIAKEVVSYYTDETNRVAYMSGNYNDGYVLYGVKLNKVEDKVKLASNFAYVYNATDLDNITYIKTEDDYSSTLYAVGFEKDSEKLGKNVNLLSSVEGSVYFTAENEVSCSLYDYVVDDYASADTGITEPNKDDYAIPYYDYYWMDSDCDAADYDELYTSCTQPVTFCSYWWFHDDSLEECAENDSLDSQSVYQTFVNKYKSMEDENGYILVTDAVKADLITLAATCGDGYDNEWLEFCFYKKQQGYDYDWDKYEEDYEKYYAVSDRIRIREELQNKENDYALRTLYCFADGKLTAINENILNVEYWNGGITFNTVDLITDKLDISEVYSLDAVRSLFYVDNEAQNYVLAFGGTDVCQMSADAAEAFAEGNEEDYMELYITKDKVYMGDNGSQGKALLVAAVKNGQVGDFDIISDDASVVEVDGSTVYYISERYENNNYVYCDLYCYDGKESKRLAQDVLFDSINLYENGEIYAYTGYRSYYGYELTAINAKGEKTLVGDSITQYIRVDKSTLLYISDGDLYLYNGKSKERVHTDVQWLWSMNKMTPAHTFGYYDYGYDTRY